MKSNSMRIFTDTIRLGPDYKFQLILITLQSTHETPCTKSYLFIECLHPVY